MGNISIINNAVSLELIVDHFSFFLMEMTCLSPYSGHEVQTDGEFDYFHSLSGESLLNGIFINDINAIEDYSAISKKLDRFNDSNNPFTLWMTGEPTPAFNQLLDSKWLKESTPLICIGSDLDEVTQLQPMKDLETKPVVSKSDYDLYMDILSTGFEFSEKSHYEFKAMLHWHDKPYSPLKHYIAYYRGDPASVISTVRHRDALGMYCGTTLPQFQKLGICTELYRFTMDEAKKSGCKTCVYQSVVPAIINHVSKKFGFIEYGFLRRYLKQNS